MARIHQPAPPLPDTVYREPPSLPTVAIDIGLDAARRTSPHSPPQASARPKNPRVEIHHATRSPNRPSPRPPSRASSALAISRDETDTRGRDGDGGIVLARLSDRDGIRKRGHRSNGTQLPCAVTACLLWRGASSRLGVGEGLEAAAAGRRWGSTGATGTLCWIAVAQGMSVVGRVVTLDGVGFRRPSCVRRTGGACSC